MAKEISKSLIIGIGGTGQRVIIALKKRLYQRFGEIPGVVKFLCIDADIIDAKDEHFSYEYDGKTYKQVIEIKRGEQFYFGKKNLLEFYDNEATFKEFTPKDFLNYAPEATDGMGAEGIRLIGKMLISTEYTALRSKIDDVIGEAISDDVVESLAASGYGLNDGRPFQTFIVGSWAGGTGSGIFKDVSDLIHTSPLLGDSTDLIGFFALPEFYTDYANTDNVRVNAYTAFMEIDHLQSPKVYSKTTDANIKTFYGQSIRRKRFNSIYVMQNKLGNSVKIDTSTMEDATSAAISNMISVIGPAIASSIVNNHQFKSNIMNGKRRGYSGFGVCEVILKRKELIHYILNKIILGELNDYIVNNYDQNEFVESVDNFIRANNLDEGVGDEANTINQLIDSLFTLSHNDLNIFFPEITISNSLVNDLQLAKFNFQQELDKKTASLLMAYDLEGIKQTLISKINTLLYTKGGISRAKYFTEIISRQISEMVAELNMEINEHDAIIQDLEETQLNNLTKEIQEKQKAAFNFFNKKKIKDLVENYSYIVSDIVNTGSIRNQYLEVIRKKKAVDIFNELKAEAKRFYHDDGNAATGKIAVIERNINESVSDMSLAIRQFDPDISTNIKIELNFFMKKILDNPDVMELIRKDVHLDVPEFIKETQNTNNLQNLLHQAVINDLDSGDGNILAQLLKHDFSVEKLIVKYKDYMLQLGDDKIGYQSKSFGDFLADTIRSKISLMWNYKNMEFKDDDQQIKLPEKIFVIGNFDGETHYFTNEVISNFRIRNIKSQGVMRVSTNDKNRITLHLQENAVPAFKLSNLDKYANEYKEKKNSETIYFFTDKRFEKFAEDIFPQDNKEKTINIWAIGFIMGLIFNERRAYYVKSSKGTIGTKVPCYEKNNAAGKNDRYLAFEYFINSDDFMKELEEKYNNWLDRDKQRLKTQLLDYFHAKMFEVDNLGKRYNSCTEREHELLFMERKALVDIGLYDLGMKDADFINRSIDGAELESHKEDLRNLGLEEVY